MNLIKIGHTSDYMHVGYVLSARAVDYVNAQIRKAKCHSPNKAGYFKIIQKSSRKQMFNQLLQTRKNITHLSSHPRRPQKGSRIL